MSSTDAELTAAAEALAADPLMSDMHAIATRPPQERVMTHHQPPAPSRDGGR